MKKTQSGKVLSLLILAIFMQIGLAAQTIKMATTTSLQDSGLLGYLLESFEKDTGIKVLAIARGTGAAIAEGRDGNVDIVFTHARQLEEIFVSEGFGTRRYPLMYNDFVLVGPKTDPAGIMGSTSISAALKKLTESDKPALFISRGDESGTHLLEKSLWQKSQTSMPAAGYLSIGQGMGKTLLMAFEKQAYTLTDRATFLRFNQGEAAEKSLVIICEGDELLHNEYAIIPVSSEKHPHVNLTAAQKLVDWLLSEKGQTLITGFKITERQVFFSFPGK